MGPSLSKSRALATVNQATAQTVGGTCDFRCTNSLNGVSVDIVNSYLQGGLKIEQQCSSDGSCSISTNMNALSDIVAKANTSSNAKGTSLISGILGTSASSNSKVDINNYIQQKVWDQCNVSSSNDMRNIQIFAANSDITGGILIGQYGATKGNCSFDTVMAAVQQSTGTAEAVATSGKDKKGEKCGSCTGSQVILTYIGIGILVIIALAVTAYIVKRMMTPAAAGTGTSGGTGTGGGTATSSWWERLTNKFKGSPIPATKLLAKL